MQRTGICVPALALAGFALALGAAHAQQEPRPAPQQMPTGHAADADVPSFGELDTQHHGYLTRGDIPKDVEGLKALRAHFREADKDGNGRLTPDEYAAYTGGK
ncbi:EF-hand domain-containing protein [Frateuria defendens]|uniref:EF-hand domain-containing protein n=1 Tax=Frateuria defendens TaxID=2219559 RepID=UPI00066FC22F|nr:EF-hand domain-containing protein [Frateuria defendens]